jgi:hypothetical protein
MRMSGSSKPSPSKENTLLEYQPGAADAPLQEVRAVSTERALSTNPLH